MGRTSLRQVAFYLEDAKVDQLKDIALRAGATQQTILRRGLELAIAEYRTKLKRRPTPR